MKHDASPEQATAKGEEAYARFPESQPVEYGGWLS
jgi:hypothetical protein